jgi:hypothetical protein
MPYERVFLSSRRVRMDTTIARAQVIDAFDSATGGYSHVLPKKWSNFIDGLAWVGMCWGACLKKGDNEVAELCERFVKTLLEVGKDARNFAPVQVDTDWVKSTTYPNLWYVAKPQEFAGPAALEFAIQCGAKIKSPFNPMTKARLLVATAGVFGWLCKYIEGLRQHLNSVWMAHLILKKKPASGLLWSAEENPFFSYVAGKKCDVVYPASRRYLVDSETTEKSVVPFQKAKPSAWPFRRDPFKTYVGEGQQEDDSYTPIAQLVGDYLQGTLN